MVFCYFMNFISWIESLFSNEIIQKKKFLDFFWEKQNSIFSILNFKNFFSSYFWFQILKKKRLNWGFSILGKNWVQINSLDFLYLATLNISQYKLHKNPWEIKSPLKQAIKHGILRPLRPKNIVIRCVRSRNTLNQPI